MSDDQSSEPVAERLLVWLRGFIRTIGMSGSYAHFIVDRVIAAMPSASEEELEAIARAWMLIALA